MTDPRENARVDLSSMPEIKEAVRIKAQVSLYIYIWYKINKAQVSLYIYMVQNKQGSGKPIYTPVYGIK